MRRLTLGLLLALSLACGASLSPRAQLVQTHQSIQTLLAAIDDAERVLCFGSVRLPPDPRSCTTTVAVQAGLTNERHRQIRLEFIKAYDAQIRLGTVITTWTPEQTINMDVAFSAAATISIQLNEMNASIPDVSSLIRSLQAWLLELSKLRTTFGGGK